MQDSRGEDYEARAWSGQELGFDERLLSERQGRLVNRDGSFTVLRPNRRLQEALSYNNLVQVSLPVALCVVLALFLLLNLLFAAIYLLCGPASLVVSGPDPKLSPFERALFFSVHTLSTIGYGNVVPVGLPANIAVAAESFLGLIGLSLITGIVFARFSRPATRLRFSERGTLTLAHKPKLVMRVTNTAATEVIQVQASAIAAFFEEGSPQRRFQHLALQQAQVASLPPMWAIIHPVDESSPFFGIDEQTFGKLEGEIIVQITGVDESSAQTVHARTSYSLREIVWGGRFAEVFRWDAGRGSLRFDPSRFDLIERPEGS